MVATAVEIGPSQCYPASVAITPSCLCTKSGAESGDASGVMEVAAVDSFYLSQCLIGIAFCFDLASFQFREKRRVLVCLSAASLLIAAHFWLLGAATAALIAVIATVRFMVAIVSHARWLVALFLSLIGIAAVLSWAGAPTVLVTLASAFSTVGAFQSSDRRFRLLLMVSTLLMIAHNTLVFTPAGILLELFFLGSNLVGYYRHYRRGNSRPGETGGDTPGP